MFFRLTERYVAIPNDGTCDGESCFYPGKETSIPACPYSDTFEELLKRFSSTFEGTDEEDLIGEIKGFWIVDEAFLVVLEEMKKVARPTETDYSFEIESKTIKTMLSVVAEKCVFETKNKS